MRKAAILGLTKEFPKCKIQEKWEAVNAREEAEACSANDCQE